ncbi:MAG: acyl-CoA dehydrogenase family protein [Candidatus Hodarchaeota archaeon]
MVIKKHGIAMESQIIPDEQLEALNLSNRYNFLNLNLQSLLNDKEMKLLKKVQRFCRKYEKTNEIYHDEDFYPWIKDFGEANLITRSANFPEIDIDNGEMAGASMDFVRAIAVDQFDPQFNMGMGATVLAINPVRHHHENREACLNALKEMVTGAEPGCILITEPMKGSDSLRPDTVSKAEADGSFTVNGVKCYNTNAPKAKWAVAYGCESPGDTKSMSQLLVDLHNDNGITIERSYIPTVPRLYIGKETFVNTKVPTDRVLGGVGKGREYQFEGLVPERIGIAALNCAELWTGFSIAAIYCNLRKQMGQEIIKHQGVGFTLTEWWSKLNVLTMAILSSARAYDENCDEHGKLRPDLEAAYAVGASQLKYYSASLVERGIYELANVMGGGGVNDNTLMKELLGISRIQEIVGGTRQIQQYVMGGFLRKLWKMSS